MLCRSKNAAYTNQTKGDGIITVKTKQAVIVGEYTSPTQPGEATKIVEMSLFASE